MPHCVPGNRLRHRRRQQVRRAVAIERQRLGALVGDDRDGGVLLDRIREIDQLARPRPPPSAALARRGEIPAATSRTVRAGGHATAGSVGKRDGDLTHWKIGRRLGLRRLGQPSRTHLARAPRSARERRLVGASGLEPPTSCVSSRRSNH